MLLLSISSDGITGWIIHLDSMYTARIYLPFFPKISFYKRLGWW